MKSELQISAAIEWISQEFFIENDTGVADIDRTPNSERIIGKIEPFRGDKYK